ncbi:MAG: hypothetical protein JW702_01165 [Clostridiales bacterium]|nr:hypothetical protein [Clostridiales bacterium]
MLLQTNLKHLETADDIKSAIEKEENLIICCGRMGPMCLPVYAAMEEMESSGEYKNVVFTDLAFDTEDAKLIRMLPEVRTFRGLPFTLYFKNGKVVKATASIQSKEQLVDNVQEVF